MPAQNSFEPCTTTVVLPVLLSVLPEYSVSLYSSCTVLVEYSTRLYFCTTVLIAKIQPVKYPEIQYLKGFNHDSLPDLTETQLQTEAQESGTIWRPLRIGGDGGVWVDVLVDHWGT